jgi:hypothetical protein
MATRSLVFSFLKLGQILQNHLDFLIVVITTVVVVEEAPLSKFLFLVHGIVPTLHEVLLVTGM